MPLTGTEALARNAKPERTTLDRKSARRGKRRPASSHRATAEGEDFEVYCRRGGTLLRTRRLIMAAVRLWELRRGLRD